MSGTKKYITILLSIIVLFGLSLLFAATDLDIWVKFGNETSRFSLMMQVLGELPAPYLFVFCGIVIVVYYNNQKNIPDRLKSLLGIACMIIGLGYSTIIFIRLDRSLFMMIGIILTAVLFGFVVIFVKKVSPERLFQLYCIAMTGFVYMLSVLVIINIFKLCWGRVRPRDLISLDEFTKFYRPQGFSGNKSFPSGHTSNATIVYIMTMFVPLVKKKLTKVLLYVVPIMWIIAMGYSRVSIGAHYASDVLYGAAISITIFYLSKHITLNLIDKSLD